MGTNCGHHDDPDTTNRCGISVGDSYDMRHFCTYLGPAGDGYRSQYCRKMSSGGEWGDPRQVNDGCSYNDCDPYQDFGFGCCKGCCGIIGGGVLCRRLSFTGDPVLCCLNDMACTAVDPNTNPSQCYSDPGMQHTCADGKNGQPNHRSIVSDGCKDVLFEYCTGTLNTDNPNTTNWLDRWTNGVCPNILARNMFQTGGPNHCFSPPVPIPGICNLPPPYPIDSEGFFWGQRLISAAMNKYQTQGFSIGTLPGFPGYHPWQDLLYSDVCCPYPGLCQDGLNRVCATKTSQRISLNPAEAQWCGCHLPEGEYQNYSARFNIPPECTPMCNRAGTIPIVGINAEPINCRQNICMIDDVTVNLVNAQIGGGLNFNQICGNCEGAQCSCIVSNTTVDIFNSIIGGNVVPISQGCGSFTCSQTNPGNTGPATITVPCGGTGPFNPYAQYDAEVAAARATAKKNAWLWTLIAIGTALVIIFFIILFIHPNLYPSSGGSIPRETPFNPQFARSTSEYSSILGSSVSNSGEFQKQSPFVSINGNENNDDFLRNTSSFVSINS